MKRIFYILFIALFIQQAATAQQFKNTPAQQLVLNTGEDSLNAGTTGHARTIISGYGDASYQRDFNAKNATLNLNRAVLFVGHQFTNKIAFFSEMELEDAKVAGGEAGGEVSMEQAYLKFSLNPRQYIVAGLFIPRIGILNENHLPVNFYGVERPIVEQLVIPATWRELGVAFYGQLRNAPLNYSVALVNGLSAAGFKHGNGIREGRAEGRMASANNMAVTASAQYLVNNWKFQVVGYMGGTTAESKKEADSLHLESGTFGSAVYLGEADVIYVHKALSAKALGCFISLPDAEKINTAYDNNTSSMMYGAYGELAYNLLYSAHQQKWKNKQLNIFARYEYIDLNASIPSNAITDGTLQQSHIIAGFNYMPIPNVCIKADVRLVNTGNENPALLLNPNPAAVPYKQSNTLLNIGVGYSF
jgi:Phosphate-selective porin O and P